jgi:hypothetical protein
MAEPPKNNIRNFKVVAGAKALTEEPAARQANPDTVKMLTEYLELAQAGKLPGIAIVSVDPEGGITTDFLAEDGAFDTLYVGIAMLEARYLAYTLEE